MLYGLGTWIDTGERTKNKRGDERMCLEGQIEVTVA
jgi:hypothetical protein